MKSPAICQGEGAVALTRRIRFVMRAMTVRDAIEPLIYAPRESSLALLIEARPQTLGVVIWPYQCLGWSARTRIARIKAHYEAIQILGGVTDFAVNDSVLLADLDDLRQGLKIVLDQASWFLREGQLVINLFVDETRMYSLAFSLSFQPSGPTAFVGAIQGRDIDGALDEYRLLTKAAHGMRPRDFLIEVFRIFCAEIGVTDIQLVSDENRHQRSSYFGKAPKSFPTNYNEIWIDRGAIKVDPMFYHLDVKARQKELELIPSKKRAMYRRRYDMLGSLKRQMHQRLSSMRGNRT